jgi:3-oxoacyl-[acyl-carrier protein] reductase
VRPGADRPPEGGAGRVQSAARVLITGGTRGIGAGLAASFAADGGAVGLIGRDERRLAATARRLDGTSTAWRVADVGDRAQISRAIGEIAAEFGGLDVLVNNAGLARWVHADSPLAQAEQLWDEVMTANLKGAFLASLAAIPYLARPGGRIINISSVTAFLGGHGGSIAYATSKAGLNGLTYALVRELSPVGITVNAVAPGFIEDTDFNADFPDAARRQVLQETPLGRTGSVADVVAAVRYLASPAASFVTGEILHVNGGRVFGR